MLTGDVDDSAPPVFSRAFDDSVRGTGRSHVRCRL